MHKFTLPKAYLSASSINTYLRCARQFKFRYIDNVISPPGIAALVGIAGHAGHEAYFQDILDGNPQRMTPEMVAELSQVKLEEAASEQDFKLDGQEKDTVMAEVGLATKTYISLAGQYVTPLEVEKEVTYTSVCGVDILGYIDLVHRPESPVLADYKFTGKKMSHPDVQNSLQFQVYALATGIPDFEVKNMVRTSTSKVLPDKGTDGPVLDLASNLRIIRHRFDGLDFDHLEDLIESVATAISAGIFPPCDMGGWNCTEKWCGYWHLCRGRGRASTLIMDMATA